MAPRKPKVDDDAASTTSTEFLKPQTTKAKVEKTKTVKTPKTKAVKKEKEKDKAEIVDDGEKAVKSKVGKKESVGAKKEGGGVGASVGSGKEKVKPVNGDEAVALMIEYLKKVNRPYSATDVSANLHGKVTKTVADKLLKEMEQNGQIMGKATKKDGGGQWVFWTIQDPADAATPDELTTMDTAINALRETIPGLKSNLKILNTKLNNLLSAPTTADLSIMIEKMGTEKLMKQEKLRGFKSGDIQMVTKEEMDRTEKEFKYWTLRRRERKKGLENLVGSLQDAVGLSREDIWEKAGIEEDVI